MYNTGMYVCSEAQFLYKIQSVPKKISRIFVFLMILYINVIFEALILILALNNSVCATRVDMNIFTPQDEV